MSDTSKAEPLAFMQCVLACSHQSEFVANFDRLAGTSIGKPAPSTPVERANDEHRRFIRFVYDFVWTRLPADTIDLDDPFAAMVSTWTDAAGPQPCTP